MRPTMGSKSWMLSAYGYTSPSTSSGWSRQAQITFGVGRALGELPGRREVFAGIETWLRDSMTRNSAGDPLSTQRWVMPRGTTT